jgi:hypothetical protein
MPTVLINKTLAILMCLMTYFGVQLPLMAANRPERYVNQPVSLEDKANQIDFSNYVDEKPVHMTRFCRLNGELEQCFTYDGSYLNYQQSEVKPYSGFIRFYFHYKNNHKLRYLRFPAFTFAEGTRVNGKAVYPNQIEFLLTDEEGTFFIDFMPDDSATPIQSVFFQDQEEFSATQNSRAMTVYFVLGCLSALLFYLIAISIQRNFNKNYLLITLIIGMSLWKYLTSETILNHFLYTYFYSHLPQSRLLTIGAGVINYMPLTLFAAVGIHFVKNRYDIVSDRYLRFVYFLSLYGIVIAVCMMAGFSLFPAFLTAANGIGLLLSLAVNIHILVRLIRQRKKHRNSVYISFAIFILNATYLFDGVNFFVLGKSLPWIGHWGMLAFVMLHSIVASKDFSDDFNRNIQMTKVIESKNEELKDFNENLEQKVRDRTRDLSDERNKIKTILDNIPQGTLTLGASAKVEDCSEPAYEILLTKDILHRDIKEALLDCIEASADAKDQLFQSLLASIGTDSLNYEANEDKIVNFRDATILLNDRLKYLQFTWTPLLKDDLVYAIILTITDITKEMELAHANQEKEIDAAILMELIASGAKKACQFFSTGISFLEENKKIFTEANLTHSDIQKAFVNMHTLKGAARTLGFKMMTPVLHEVEDFYQAILRHGDKMDNARLLSDIDMAYAIFNRYLDSNRNKLGRKDDYSSVVIERDFIEEHVSVLNNLVSGDTHISRLKETLAQHSSELLRKINDQLDQTFNEYKEKAQKIARDLGKAPPTFQFDIDPISIKPETRVLLDNCMVHLIRNALDHGIEMPEVRRAKGKPESGLIVAKASLIGSTIHIEMYDDGRGLAIGVLRKKGLENGTISEHSTIQEVANSIFLSGMSTAEAVTDISGRGVGMDAVKSFLQEAGGSIRIEVSDPKDQDRNFYSFKFCLTICSNQVRPTEKSAA